MELRARFDEQNNIDWSKQLESAGCTVIYGFDDYKVHSKLTLITKKSKEGYSYITQIGTGNYNEKTSELYTDYSFITADHGIGEEASNVFQNLAVQKLTEESDRMLVAPLRFKSVLLEEMDRVIAAAHMGRPASMILKNNSISDRDIILKLQEASCAGVRIDMIVRGICCVRAGVPGKTENLHIRSLVGRYLEHGRIYSFFDGAHTRIYIASGDFLTRNTECRVEVGVRVEDPVLVRKLTDILQLQLRDNVNAREMRPDGSYQKVKPAEGEALVNGQMGMYELLKNDWTQPEPWKLSAAAQEKQPEPSAEAAKPEPAKTEAAPAAKQAEASHPESAAAPESGDRFDQLEQMVNHKKAYRAAACPCSQADKAGGGGDTRPQKPPETDFGFLQVTQIIFARPDRTNPLPGLFCVFACINKKQTEGGRQKVRAKRWGRAGHGREQPRRRVFFLAVLAGLLVCVVLPVRAQKKNGEALFPAGHHTVPCFGRIRLAAGSFYRGKDVP